MHADVASGTHGCASRSWITKRVYSPARDVSVTQVPVPSHGARSCDVPHDAAREPAQWDGCGADAARHSLQVRRPDSGETRYARPREQLAVHRINLREECRRHASEPPAEAIGAPHICSPRG